MSSIAGLSINDEFMTGGVCDKFTPVIIAVLAISNFGSLRGLEIL